MGRCRPDGRRAAWPARRRADTHLVRWRAWAWAPPLAIAWGGADGALGHEGGLQALRKGRQGLLRIGCTGKGRAAQVLEGFDFLRFELYWGVPLKHVRTQGGNLQDHGLHLQFVVTAF